MLPSAMGRSIPRRGIWTRYPSGIGPIVGAIAVAPVELVGAGVALASALGKARGATDPVRGRVLPARRAIPTAKSSTPASAVKERDMRLVSDAERMPSERASIADRRAPR